MYLKDIDLDHLIKSLEKHYDVTLDKEGKEYVKIESDWDYDKRKVHLSSMAPYLQNALRQFDNLDLVPTKLDYKCQDSPYPHVEPNYGAKQQFAKYDTPLHLLGKINKHFFSKSQGNSTGMQELLIQQCLLLSVHWLFNNQNQQSRQGIDHSSSLITLAHKNQL
jgi:hypothetical protein